MDRKAQEGFIILAIVITIIFLGLVFGYMTSEEEEEENDLDRDDDGIPDEEERQEIIKSVERGTEPQSSP